MSEKNIEKKLDLILEQINSIKNSFIAKGYIEDDRIDENIYKDAKALILKTGKASASLLQRKFKIGYAHAARVMDLLEEDGVVGPINGVEPREVFNNK